MPGAARAIGVKAARYPSVVSSCGSRAALSTKTTNFSDAYETAKECCSGEIKAYAACVQGNLSDVSEGCCEKEFRKLRKCFDDARRKGRG